MYNHSEDTGAGYTYADPNPNLILATDSTGGEYTSPSVNYSGGPHYYTTCYNDDNGGSNSSITRYIDGVEIYQLVNWKWNASLGGTGYGPDPTTILNLAVGGGWTGTMDLSGVQNFGTDPAHPVKMDIYSVEYYTP
jgi:hypothetical protein